MTKRWSILAAVIGLGVAVDQGTKHLADSELRSRGIVILIDGFLDLRYSRNPGVFFGFGAQMSDLTRSVVIIGASLIAVAMITYLFQKSDPGQRLLRWALMLLLAGALGNLVDRVRTGDVIDFLHLHWREDFHWATFNVADVCIAIGVCLLVIEMVQPRPDAQAPRPGLDGDVGRS